MNLIFKSKMYLTLIVFIIGISCNSVNRTHAHQKEEKTTPNQLPNSGNSQIGEYVTGVFEDSKGNIWFSTLSEGMAKYDGNKLTYDTRIGNRVGSIVEDSNNNLWFGTHSGVYKYDGKTFTNYTVNDGLCDNLVSNILINKSGNIWVGTWGGVCKFNGNRFEHFPLPIPDIELLPYQSTMNWITEIMEDSKGNIWFGRDGYGATKYDPSASLRTGGKSFTHFTKKDGLASNNIRDIEEDKQGNIWFASRVTEKDHPDANKRLGSGGLVKYDGKNFIDFPNLEGLYNSDVYQIYKDTYDNIWIGTTSKGVYKYDGYKFTNYRGKENKFSNPIVSILQDSKNKIWLGCSGGLFRLDGGDIINVTTGGPWK
jgi:ligand-binding sensor domain-containing protein